MLREEPGDPVTVHQGAADVKQLVRIRDETRQNNIKLKHPVLSCLCEMDEENSLHTVTFILRQVFIRQMANVMKRKEFITWFIYGKSKHAIKLNIVPELQENHEVTVPTNIHV